MEGTEAKNQNQDEMAKLWINILTSASRQGFSIVLLVVISYYFQVKNDKLEEKVDGCISGQVEQYKTRAERTEKLLERSTIAVESFSVYLQQENISSRRK